MLKLLVKCSTCNGTGMMPIDENGVPSSVPCTACGHDGWLDSGFIDIAEITDKLDSVISSQSKMDTILSNQDMIISNQKEAMDYLQKILDVVENIKPKKIEDIKS